MPISSDVSTLSGVSELDALATQYSKTRDNLSTLVADLDTELKAIRRKRITAIKAAAAQAKEYQELLRAHIAANPNLFAKRKTTTVAGIKVGFQKSKVKLDWDNATDVVERIRKHFAESAALFIRTKEEPINDALLDLDEKELKKIGVRKIGGVDEVLVKSTDSEIDKIVASILEEGAQAEEQAGA